MDPEPPKPKRTLFKRPAWAAREEPSLEPATVSSGTTTITSADGPVQDIFTQQSKSYRGIIAEQERQRKARLEEKKRAKQIKKEKKAEAKKERCDENSGAREGKRRRISDEDDALIDAVGSDGEGADGICFSSPRKPAAKRTASKDTILTSPSGELPFSPKPAKQDATVIELGDSDDDATAPVSTKPTPTAENLDPTDGEEDEELAELARQARARRRQRELDLKRSATPQGTSPSLPTPPPAPDPVLKLLVSSTIPDTEPLIAKRKLSQRLREVREAWCKRQNLPDEMANRVFLVYCGRKLYDVTTCRSLGIAVDADGNVIRRGESAVFRTADDAAKIHLWAHTDESFEKWRAEKARKESGVDGVNGATDGEEVGGATGAEREKQEELIRVILKAKGFKDYKLRIKPVSFGSALNAERYLCKIGGGCGLIRS